MKFEFSSPPPRGRNTDEEQELANSLRSKPGEWAKVTDLGNPDGFSAKIRTGKGVFTPDTNGSFDSRVVKGDVYARYEITSPVQPTREVGSAAGLGDVATPPRELGVDV
jgi:hypothetical protein